MTSAARDLSNYGGAPVTLYEFNRRSVPTISQTPVITYWRYTSTDRDYTFDSHLYSAGAISDDGIRQAGDTSSDEITIKMPYTDAIPQMFAGSPPSDPISLVIRRTHVGETDGFILWAGVVGLVSRTDDDLSASVVCNTLSSTMDRTGLRLAWGRMCPHDLYGFECRANPRDTDFFVSGTVSALNATTVVCSAFSSIPVPRFLGGFIEWLDDDGHAERRGIIGHSDSTFVKILGTTDRMHVGLSIWAFLGCDRTRQTCKDVFNNIINHGGHAYMPDKNPFNGDRIF